MSDLAVHEQAANLIVMNVETGEVTFNHNGLDPLIVRARIAKLAKDMLALECECNDELPVEHEFVDGMYVRRLFIPKGTLLVGKVHKKPCVNFVEKGDISILTETGQKRVTAGFSIVSPAGLQKVGFAHEDTVFTNVFRTDVTDPEKVEEDIACDSYEVFQRLEAAPRTLVIEGN